MSNLTLNVSPINGPTISASNEAVQQIMPAVILFIVIIALALAYKIVS